MTADDATHGSANSDEDHDQYRLSERAGVGFDFATYVSELKNVAPDHGSVSFIHLFTRSLCGISLPRLTITLAITALACGGF